jgi:hypothetical protein
MSEEIRKENERRKEAGNSRFIYTGITGCMVRKT